MARLFSLPVRCRCPPAAIFKPEDATVEPAVTHSGIVVMKRLVFCFDGTWNQLGVDTPTNVVLLAASIRRTARGGTPQLIHYDEGVGTGRLEYWSGGIFGVGLMANVREAFRFLIFNYDPGDQIQVFGFSRGAFSARTFIGLLRHVGPLSRLHAGRIDEALALYRRRSGDFTWENDEVRRFRAKYSQGVCNPGDDAHRCHTVDGYQAGSLPDFSVDYLGVWDTVGALGLPSRLPFAAAANRKHRFHDTSLDTFVQAARHAVALDERRALFPSTSLGDLRALNTEKGIRAEAADAPYQERWFPGTHGSVGGGGDIRGLSDGSLSWILKGAVQAGLDVDTARGTRLYTFEPDALAPLRNQSIGSVDPTSWVTRDRDGPRHLWQLSSGAVRRWQSDPRRLPEQVRYRPGSLAQVRSQLEALTPYQFNPPERLLATETVKAGDTLSGYAMKHYGDAELFPMIFVANLDRLLEADDIHPGQRLRIPDLSPPKAQS